MMQIEAHESLRAARDDRRVRDVVAGPVSPVRASIGDRRWIDPDRPGEGRAGA
jgi:hypothetical protein